MISVQKDHPKKVLRRQGQRSERPALLVVKYSSSNASFSSISSLDNIDTLGEDLNRSKLSRAIGYMGKD
jgi:hypothetical protein